MKMDAILVSKNKKVWLLGLIVLVLCMIFVGGRTRLTRSGLSITEWKPIVGVLPPLTESQWEEEFAGYKNTPEFKGPNAQFELADYKNIYFLEYVHRLLGRLIFLYVLMPGLLLVRRKEVSVKLLVGLLSLVLVQGLMGWVMVKSGLQNEPRVSPFLLAAHFFLAQALLIASFYQIASTRVKLGLTLEFRGKLLLAGVGVLLTLQLFYGCLTSGLHAGLVSDSFPFMGGQFAPDSLWSMSPTVRNFFENPFTVQWTHRWVGVSTLMTIFMMSGYFIKAASKKARGPFFHLMGMTVAQVALGILVIVFQVPISLANLHQLLGSLVFLGYFNIIFRI
jgi:cytochrome c oxidase assembly protein subunit 15